MQGSTVLDLGTYYQPAVPTDRRKNFIAMGAVLLVGLVAALALSTGALGQLPFGRGHASDENVVRIPFEDLRAVSAMTVDDKAQIVIEGLAAQQKNAALPLTSAPLERVRQFVADGSGEFAYAQALKCLTQAVYYEAANEPLQGRRAVAQVVLNRVRHPAYPKSVCGVVYEGAERQTGCQFSFTCDGALLRRPALGPWREAEAVARAALAGYVEKSVGTATHYHADYVLPKWAFQLGKIEQLGRHIFYRFNGSWGRANAFTGHYSGIERIPAINFVALQARVDGMGDPADGAFVPGLTVTPHVSDRHAENDVAGRLDTTKEWRLTIPDPVAASSRYHETVSQPSGDDAPKAELAVETHTKVPVVR